MAGRTQGASKVWKEGRATYDLEAGGDPRPVRSSLKDLVVSDQALSLPRPSEAVPADNEYSSPTIADLPSLSRTALGSLWTRLFNRPVPRGLSPQLMIRFLAFELQARTSCGLPAGFTEALAKCAGAAAAAAKPATRLRPGGRLLREWNGVTHVVDIDEGGFLWSGRRFGSLSAIAKEITGAHWSGLRFFGLTGDGAAAGAKGGEAGRVSKAVSEKLRGAADAGPREPASKRSSKGSPKTGYATAGGPA